MTLDEFQITTCTPHYNELSQGVQNTLYLKEYVVMGS